MPLYKMQDQFKDQVWHYLKLYLVHVMKKKPY